MELSGWAGREERGFRNQISLHIYRISSLPGIAKGIPSFLFRLASWRWDRNIRFVSTAMKEASSSLKPIIFSCTQTVRIWSLRISCSISWMKAFPIREAKDKIRFFILILYAFIRENTRVKRPGSNYKRVLYECSKKTYDV